MAANDELKSREFAEFLEADEKLLYAGHGQTGSILRFPRSILAPLMGWDEQALREAAPRDGIARPAALQSLAGGHRRSSNSVLLKKGRFNWRWSLSTPGP